MKKNNYEVLPLKINGIFGNLYYVGQPGKYNSIVVFGKGAPTTPDNGNLDEAQEILNYQTDLFVPDYIGYARSDGDHTPINCVNTFLNLYENFTKGCNGSNKYLDLNIKLKYDRVIFMGRSYGGIYVPLLPRFNKLINEICIIFGSVNNAACDNFPEKETNQKFMSAMKDNGYHHLYRGILDAVWEKHLRNEDDLAPIQEGNINYLENTHLFIGHGKKDRFIDYSIAEDYYLRIKNMFPSKKNLKFKLYPGDHDGDTSKKIIKDFLNWIKLPKADSI